MNSLCRLLSGVFVALGVTVVALPAWADEDVESRSEGLPLWELGVGLSAFSFPDYPGAGHRSAFVLPFPRVIYRGKYLSANRGGIRGRLFSSRWLELDISTGGNLPANSDDNPERKGMPDLDPSFEIGPSLRLKLIDEDRYLLQVRVNARALITAEEVSRLDYQGLLYHPELRFERYFGDWGVLTATLESRYGDQDFHNYYYGVSPRFATADRPVYDADGGFSGYGSNIRFRWQGNKGWRYSFGLRYYELQDATFQDSPLFAKNSASYFFMSVSRVLWQSDRLTTAP